MALAEEEAVVVGEAQLLTAVLVEAAEDWRVVEAMGRGAALHNLGVTLA